jgi:predicted NBD/HSP70 family sugar kinase
MASHPERAGTVDPGTMRSVNRSLVLDAVKQRGPISRAAIAKSVSLAKPTVSLIVDGLLAADLVREVGSERDVAARGRPPVMIEYNARSRYVAGIHVGVQGTTVVVADGTGAEVGRRRRPTPRAQPEVALGEIVAALDEAVEETGGDRRLLSAVGVCLPGLVDFRAGTCVHAPNLGWRDVPVGEILLAQIGAPAFVHNTVQAAAAAECLEGAGRGARTVALLYAGTGIGAAIVQDGRVFHGSGGLAGEIGHSVVAGASEKCACGRRGCLETVASAPAVARSAHRAVAAGRQTRMARPGDPPTARDVCAAAEAGDEVAGEILADAGRALGIAGSWLVNLVNPDVLVLGGGLVGAGEHLVGPFRDAMHRHVVAEASRQLTVRTWALGQEAKVRGAVILALQSADRSYRLVFTA